VSGGPSGSAAAAGGSGPRGAGAGREATTTGRWALALWGGGASWERERCDRAGLKGFASSRSMKPRDSAIVFHCRLHVAVRARSVSSDDGVRYADGSTRS